MLTIRKVPTLVSNYQEDDISEDTEKRGCGLDCLGKCCLPVSRLPLYTFKNGKDATMKKCPVKIDGDKGPLSVLNNLLLGQWEDRMSRGLFRYDVTTCETKILPGPYGFITQLNEGRHLKKRPTEFCVDLVLQPFDENKFNFTKIGQEEVLFRFEASNDDMAHFYTSPLVDDDSSSPNIVAINVSPIEYGHMLLIPRVVDCLPQRIDHDSLMLALYFAKETGDPFFRVGYNSLGAFASINHLHFQAYYLAVTFPVEKAPAQRIMSGKECGVVVSQLLNYPIRCLVFEGGDSLQKLSEAVANSCIRLQNKNIPFNILIADSGDRIFLFPQCYAEKQALGEVGQDLLETQVNPAAWEIGGHMVLKRRKDYDVASEEYVWRLLAEVSLSEERFQDVKLHILAAAGLQEVNLEDISADQGGNLYEPLAHEVPPHLPKDCLVFNEDIDFWTKGSEIFYL